MTTTLQQPHDSARARTSDASHAVSTHAVSTHALSDMELATLRALRLGFAGGGTGGHLVPGLHLLDHARERAALPSDLVWFTSGRAVEERVLGGDALRGITTERCVLPIEGTQGGAPSRSRLVLRTPRAVALARRALAAHRTQLLLGLGGFTTLPAVLAARSLKIPVVLLEINAQRGAATRWLSPLAARVVHAWRATLPAGESARETRVGPPLAPRFARGPVARDEALACRARLGFDPLRPLLVVLGGSQGAGPLNRFVRENARRFLDSGVQVLHQTGPTRLHEGAGELGRDYRACEYVEDVHTLLAGATLALCRGGASTLAEIAALRVPAWVAPYPHADRHQERNARELGEGVRLIDDAALDTTFASELVRVAGDGGDAERAGMSDALGRALTLDAAARIWSEVCALAAPSTAGERA